MGSVAQANVCENKVYCPCCGKRFTDYLDGEQRNPCQKCGAYLKITVKGRVYFVVGTKTDKNRQK